MTTSAPSLTLVHQTLGLPLSFPAFAVGLGGWCHLLAMDISGRGMVRFFLDPLGQPARSPEPLPLSHASGAAACRGQVLVTGAHAGNDRPVVLGLDPTGGPLWSAEVPVGEALVRWPWPACDERGGRVLWETGGNTSHLWFADLDGPSLGEPRSLALVGRTEHLAALGTKAGLLVARTFGPPPGLELLWVEGGQVKAGADVRAGPDLRAPSLARIGESWSLVWISGRELRLRAFAPDLAPVGGTQVLFVAEESRTLHSARWLPGEGPHWAISVRSLAFDRGLAAVPGETDAHGAPRHERGYNYEQLVALFAEPARLGPGIRLAPASIWGDPGTWVGETLFMVHGREPVVSVLRPTEFAGK